jgi:hypothetical protein
MVKNIESEVLSVNLCRELKMLGYPQDATGWYWVSYQGTYYSWWRLYDIELTDYKFYDIIYEKVIYLPKDMTEIIKAPTCQEMLYWLYENGYTNISITLTSRDYQNVLKNLAHLIRDKLKEQTIK